MKEAQIHRSNLYTFFRDSQIEQEITEKGFFKTPLLDKNDIKTLKDSYKQLYKKAAQSIHKEFWPSGRHPNAEVRNFAKDSIEKIVPIKLKTLIKEETTTLIGGTFLVKPPSKRSMLSPHQDSSHVDERFGFSVYVWIPLQNVNRWNGCFHYLPGSHQWGIQQRSLNVSWPLSDKAPFLQKYMKPISMKAGEALFFHSALIHSSPPNYSFSTRVAINYYIHPKNSPFCHFYEDGNTPKGKVEKYSVQPDFYYNEDFQQKPNTEKYPLLEIIDKSTIDWEKIKEILL